MTDQDFKVDTKGLKNEPIKLRSGVIIRPNYVNPYHIRWASKSGMCVIASYDDEAHGRLLHISVSWDRREPTWPELLDVQGGFAPTLPMMMVLPTPQQYVNNHQFALNMFEIPKGWLEQLAEVQGPAIAQGKLHDGLEVTTNGGVVVLSQRGVKPSWERLVMFRKQYFTMDRSAMVWWDAPGIVKPDLKVVRLAFTPVAWEAGAAVGIPGMTHSEARAVVMQHKYANGEVPVKRRRRVSR